MFPDILNEEPQERKEEKALPDLSIPPNFSDFEEYNEDRNHKPFKKRGSSCLSP
jgi:hypothetical protein